MTNLLNMLNNGNINPNVLIQNLLKQNPNLQGAYNQMLQLQKQSKGNINNVNIKELLQGKRFSNEEIEKFKSICDSLGIPKEEVNKVLSNIK